ncbi:MAG: hypothetical protein V1781_04585 [Bacteroidota bacterium]
MMFLYINFMKKWKILLYVSTILIFLFSSCNEKPDCSKEISHLDSAEIVLDNAKKNLLLVDTNYIRTFYNSTADNLHVIMKKISGDTINKITIMFLSDAYQQSENIFNLLNNIQYLVSAISETKQRISNLKHDLNKNLIEKTKFSEYVVSEMNISKKIYDTVNNVVIKTKSSITKLDSLKAQITALADSLILK